MLEVLTPNMYCENVGLFCCVKPKRMNFAKMRALNVTENQQAVHLHFISNRDIFQSFTLIHSFGYTEITTIIDVLQNALMCRFLRKLSVLYTFLFA